MINIQYNLQMEGNSNAGLFNVPADITVGRSGSEGVHTVHGKFVVLHLHLPLALLEAELDDGVERHLQVGQLLQGAVQQHGQQAAESGLVGDDQEVVGGGDRLHQ